MKTWKLLGIGFLVLFGGFVVYRYLLPILLLAAYHHTPTPVRAKAMVLDAYPFDEGLSKARAKETPPSRYIAENRKEVGEAQAIKRAALQETKGDVPKALDVLVVKSHTPAGAQALFEAMRELAPQGDQRLAATASAKKAPLFKASEAEPGVVQVARMAQVLGERLKAPKVNPLDPILAGEAIRLLGRYGAPQTDQNAAAVSVATPEKTVPVIHPVVRGVLRTFLQSPEPFHQAMACQALGRLGDAQTAEEMIQNPKAYPWASLANFPPDQVQKWKQHRLAMLKSGRGGSDAAFWQGVRLTPSQQDVAVELAMAGDGGAATAMLRNLSIEALNARDPDEYLAKQLDIRLRFPGTPEAFKAEHALDSVSGLMHQMLNMEPDTILQEAFLRAYEHDLKLIFTTSDWRPDQMVLGQGPIDIPQRLWHLRISDPAQWQRHGHEKYYPLAEALFRKYYKPRIVYTKKWGLEYKSICLYLSRYARHLGLPSIDYVQRKSDVYYRRGLAKRGELSAKDPCVAAGHLKGPEDF